ncbi:MAG TPA: class I SAM-dependent methyltransferase [Bordetella sp.]|uniref:class I SAM-dependent methyltransferase n=1 Tax=Bordetella sp. TaxID=28081 RepID=UPI002ED0EA08
MAYIDFLTAVHSSTKRDYLARVNDPEYPKPKAAELAKRWDFDYWDGDRRVCYGGYRYMPGRWAPVAQALIDHYGLKAGDKVLDIGCGKGFLLYEMSLLEPGLEICGIDISPYAIEHAKEEIRDRLQVANAIQLPFPDDHFDLVFSITTLHNLHNYDLDKALREMERVGKKNKYLCVESYRNETEKANLLYWQVTCEAFCTPEEWGWWFRQTGYTGDHSFIYFE